MSLWTIILIILVIALLGGFRRDSPSSMILARIEPSRALAAGANG